MTDLRARIVEAIRANGPMPVSLYMLMCLHDPREGYYATRPGFNQDFTTSPETSQVFGELAGLWAAHEWIKLGAPEKFWLIELGPGRGTMMADLLRAAYSVTGFAEAAQVALIEASPALRDQQGHLLSKYAIQHFDELDSVPPGPSIIVANEFLDCLAVRQYARDGNGWRERQVGLDKDGNLVMGIGPPADLPEDVIPVGDHVEVAPALATLVSSVASRFRQHPGRALFLDYGPDDRSPDETLRAYKAGEQVHPLAQPGASDLTADVDFPRLRRISESEGLAVHGPIQQRYFLTRLGAKERAEQLIAANPRRAEEIARAIDKLVSPEQMGSRFKAIALTPFGADTLPVSSGARMTIDRPPFEEAPAIKRFSMHVRHGFFGRRGGVSHGVYKSLNCGHGSGDEPEKVLENRRRVAHAMGAPLEKLASPRQIHSSKAVITDRAYEPNERPECDALVTNRPGLLLGVLAADCAPIVLCDPHNGVIAAIHAGWRGAVGGVIESAVEAMSVLGADPAKTAAGVGPCLSQSSFEVGPDLADAVLDATPWAETLFEPGQGDRQFFDLKRYCLGRLARLGVAHVDALEDDTLTQSDVYFSHRASVKAGDRDCGRNMTAIMLVG